MSRGLGKVQRMCMNVLAQEPEPMDSIAIAARALGKDQINENEHVSFRRALRKLARAGKVVNLGRSFHNNRRHWALPEGADRYFDDLARCFGPQAAAQAKAKANVPAVNVPFSTKAGQTEHIGTSNDPSPKREAAAYKVLQDTLDAGAKRLRVEPLDLLATINLGAAPYLKAQDMARDTSAAAIPAAFRLVDEA